MVQHGLVDQESDTLPHIPPDLKPWMRALVTFGFVSFTASVTLWVVLIYRLISWRFRHKRTNQFAILIFNLVLADIQQSMAFLLNVEWLRLDSIVIKTPICFAQGWFVSVGDLSSGVWCFVIGLHTLASVILNYRLSQRSFYITIVALWVFIFGISSIPIALYGKAVFVRAGVWCWIQHDLGDLRLWTHYVWIFLFEFGNIIIYTIIYAMLIQRIRSGYYTAMEADRVKAISNLMVAYPVVYVICTLPLASARMAGMSGKPPSWIRYCISGAFITSNGWVDVLLYTLTRRIMIFSDEPPADDNGFDTFAAFWSGSRKRFGASATCEATPSIYSTQKRKPGCFRGGRGLVTIPDVNDSSEDLYGINGTDIKLVTTTQVTSEPAQPADYEEMELETRKLRPRTPAGRWSEDSGIKELGVAHLPR